MEELYVEGVATHGGPELWTVVESAVEDIVDGADGNRRLGRHGDALVGDVTAVSLA